MTLMLFCNMCSLNKNLLINLNRKVLFRHLSVGNGSCQGNKGLVLYKLKSSDYLNIIKAEVAKATTWYEELTGITEVKKAHDRVVEATTLMRMAQEDMRNSRGPLLENQKKLQQVMEELKKVERWDDRYIEIVKTEHQLLRESKHLQETLQEADKNERAAFEHLSSSLRISHEVERAQDEKRKYWSLIASICGTIIGVVGTTISNRYKMAQVLEIAQQSSNSETILEIDRKINKLTELIYENSSVPEKDPVNVLANVQTELNHTDFIIKCAFCLGGYIVLRFIFG